MQIRVKRRRIVVRVIFMTTLQQAIMQQVLIDGLRFVRKHQVQEQELL